MSSRDYFTHLRLNNNTRPGPLCGGRQDGCFLGSAILHRPPGPYMSPAAASPSQAETPAAGADAPALRVSPSPRPAGRLALELAVPGSRSLAGYEAAVGRLSRNVKLPGFRKGRVPRPVLLQQLGPARVRATALEELIESCFRQAVSQEGIKPLSQPDLAEDFAALLERFEPGQELVFSLEFDIEPNSMSARW